MTGRTTLLCGLLIAAQLPGTARAACQLGRIGSLPVEILDERATTRASVNGRDTRFILDTGAFYNSMSQATAQALGLPVQDFNLEAEAGTHLRTRVEFEGIGGRFQIGRVTIDHFGLLGRDVRHVDFAVGGSDTGPGLIGANLLDAADLELDLANGKIQLIKPEGCDGMGLAYWTKDGVFQTATLQQPPDPRDRRSHVDVVINGRHVRAVIDTGADVTVLSRRAAERAGLDLASAKPSFAVGGLGTRTYRSWIAKVDSFSLGTETIQHSQMQVMDGDIGSDADGEEMLLGLDFVLAHHMFVANSQNKLYFTYNGGRVFSLAAANSGDRRVSASGSAGNAATPPSAADYALRAQARLARGDPQGALADLDAAIRMDGKNAGYFLARARANLSDHASGKALADLDSALALAPNDIEALLLRSELNSAAGKTEAAATDIAAARKIAPPGSIQSREIASYYIDNGHAAQALPLLDGWIALHRDDSDLGGGLDARCRARALANRELDAALADCQAAIRHGRNAEDLTSLGLTQLRLRQDPAAIASFTAALAQDPRLGWALYGRGLARLRSGQGDAGKADVAAAKAAMPGIVADAGMYGLSES